MFYILQYNGYVTINQLMEYTNLSRTTIIKELNRLEEKLEKMNLRLERKAHYGISIKGCEQDYRKAFLKYVLGSDFYLEPAKEYKYFLESIDEGELRSVLNNALAKNDFRISDVAFDNLIMHLKILIFRATQRNYIAQEIFPATKIDHIYFQVANYVNEWLINKYHFSLPESEISYLAVHISAKTFTMTIDSREKDTLLHVINEILKQLDKEFLTFFGKDVDLANALLLHMYPLLQRLYYNLQLENPIIEDIYTKYANVFVVSYRFGELIEKRYGFSLSRDEIGYLAIHFATHFERLKNNTLEKIKRIVVICTTGGGSAHLLQLKLENVFSKAIVITTTLKDISDFDKELPDLFLSTIPVAEHYKEVPIIHIKQFLDEAEIRKIKEQVMFQSSGQVREHKTLKIHHLFFKELFNRVQGSDYMKIIQEQANIMTDKGFASSDFTQQVLLREKKFYTIYQNGIAGPHPMKLNAHTNSVGITILEEPIEWQGRYVQIIFLINLKQGHLFLHKEISRLLLCLIDNDAVREKLLKSLSFEQFIAELKKLM